MIRNYRRPAVLILMMMAVIHLGVAQSHRLSSDNDSAKVQIGASLNPLLVVMTGGTFTTSPQLSLQAKFLGDKLNKRLALEYLPGNTNYPFGNQRFLEQTDSTVTYLSEELRRSDLRLAFGLEKDLNQGRIQSYIGVDAFVGVNFTSYNVWTTTTLGDSTLNVLPTNTANASDVALGVGGRVFFGVKGKVSDRLSISTEIAPTFQIVNSLSYSADRDLNITSSRANVFDFTNVPLVNIRMHYNFY